MLNASFLIKRLIHSKGKKLSSNMTLVLIMNNDGCQSHEDLKTTYKDAILIFHLSGSKPD